MVEKQEVVYLKFDTRLISKDNEKIYNKSGRFYLSDKYKMFANDIALLAKQQYHDNVLTSDLKVYLIAYFTNRKHCDLFNLPKGVMDALQGIIYKNDSQIKKGMIEIREDSNIDHFEIYVTEFRR